jgi:hypothetical protein
VLPLRRPVVAVASPWPRRGRFFILRPKIYLKHYTQTAAANAGLSLTSAKRWPRGMERLRRAAEHLHCGNVPADGARRPMVPDDMGALIALEAPQERSMVAH